LDTSKLFVFIVADLTTLHFLMCLIEWDNSCLTWLSSVLFRMDSSPSRMESVPQRELSPPTIFFVMHCRCELLLNLQCHSIPRILALCYSTRLSRLSKPTHSSISMDVLALITREFSVTAKTRSLAWKPFLIRRKLLPKLSKKRQLNK